MTEIDTLLAHVTKTSTLCMTLMLIAGCASRERAANGKHATVNPTDTISPGSEPFRESYHVQTAELIKAINSTNSTLEAMCDFGVSDIFAELIRRADLAFESVGNGESITLKRPKYVYWMPISELDSMLARPGLRKEVAVVVIGQWSWRVPTEEEEKTMELSEFWIGRGQTPEEFAFEVREKLRKAGFRQVIFASKYNGLYRRMPVGWTPTKEEARSEEREANGKDAKVKEWGGCYRHGAASAAFSGADAVGSTSCGCR
jgi:hypothetical protein